MYVTVVTINNVVRSGSAEIALDYMNTALILEKKQRPPDPDHKGDDMVYIIRWRDMTVIT